MTENLAEDLDELARELDRDYVFHSWSAQAQLDLAGDRRRPRAPTVWDHDGQPLPRLLEPARQRQHRAPASGRRRRRSRSRPALLATIGPATANLARGEAAQRILVEGARRLPARCSSPTAAPTRTRTRSAWRACTPAATRCCRPTARTTATPARRSSRPATGDGCRTSTPAGTCTSSAPTSTAASSGRRRPRRSRSGPCTTSSASSSPRARRRSPRSCSRSIPAPPASCVPPPGYLAGVRALCDRYGIILILDEVMCGFGRTGRWFAFEGYDVVPDLITFAKGVNSGLRAGRRRDHLGRDRGDVRRPGVPGRAHLQRAPAGGGIHRRVDRRDGDGGHRRERPPRSART